MAWIKTIPFEEADAQLQKMMLELRASYPSEYNEPVPQASNSEESVIASHTLIPDAMFHAFAEFSALMSPDLRRVTLDDDLIKALREDYRTAPITEAEMLMCDYVVQLTKDATKIHPGYHERLRSVGFDDQAILQITLIASWFNYINRVADALGIGRE